VVHRKDWIVSESLKQDIASIPQPPVAVVAGARQKQQVLSFENADLRLVLNALAKQAGISLIVPDDVKGTVTARLDDVDFASAVKLLVRASNYDLFKNRDIFLVHRKTWAVPDALQLEIMAADD